MGKALIGTIITINSPQIAELVSLAGFDWVMIDMEHSTLSVGEVQGLIQSLDKGVISIVRVPSNEDVWIKRVLDTGCNGIMVPMVLTSDDAARAVQSMRYPPEGARSVGLSRAQKYGHKFEDYLFKDSRDLRLLIQIEHIDAVNNLDSIIQVEGISTLFIGPYDLSASLGKPGEVGSEEVQLAINTIKQKCRDNSISWGIFGMNPDVVGREISDGCRWALCGIDTVIFSDKAHSIVSALRIY